MSWSHYTELLAISDDLARSFYEQQCIQDRWSVRELKRQKDSALFERVALSKDRAEILALAKDGQRIESARDVVLNLFPTDEGHNYYISVKKSLIALIIKS